MDVYGDPSAIVCVKTGDEALARLAARELPGLGLVANLVEFPAVGKGMARFRLQVMAKHTDGETEAAAERVGMGLEIARRHLEGRAAASGPQALAG